MKHNTTDKLTFFTFSCFHLISWHLNLCEQCDKFVLKGKSIVVSIHLRKLCGSIKSFWRIEIHCTKVTPFRRLPMRLIPFRMLFSRSSVVMAYASFFQIKKKSHKLFFITWKWEKKCWFQIVDDTLWKSIITHFSISLHDTHSSINSTEKNADKCLAYQFPC